MCPSRKDWQHESSSPKAPEINMRVILNFFNKFAEIQSSQGAPPVSTTVQGADNKLGQFLCQDIYATANHRNCLRHSLESCSSLV